MRKVIIIALLGILITSCSVTRNRSRIVPEVPNNILSGNIIEIVKNKNITNECFFIQKAEIEILTPEGNNKFIASIKFVKPDKYLVSIKSKTGIEGARIYISGDSVLVNDRINKKVYLANSIYLRRKYGLTQNLLPLIFGDIILARNCETGLGKCVGGVLNIECMVKGVKLIYSIDCEKRKVNEVIEVQTNMYHGIKIKCQKFINKGNIVIPGIVEIEDRQNNTVVNIKIKKIESPWKGSVKFIPGKGYELIELV